jgi:hypothetical protein
MATEPTPPVTTTVPPGQSVSGLVSGILDDAQTLFKQQVEMFKAEVREDFRRSKRAAEYGALGVVLATVGALGLVTAIVYLLHEQYQFTMWASWLIVGGAFTVAGVAFGFASYYLLERFNPLPDKTFSALQENLSWKTK